MNDNDNDYDDDGPPWKGRGARLHEALEDAWEHAKGKTEARTFEVESIVIEVENPITAYIVKINPTG
jgi:hypothetical protein